MLTSGLCVRGAHSQRRRRAGSFCPATLLSLSYQAVTILIYRNASLTDTKPSLISGWQPHGKTEPSLRKHFGSTRGGSADTRVEPITAGQKPSGLHLSSTWCTLDNKDRADIRHSGLAANGFVQHPWVIHKWIHGKGRVA